MVKFGKSIVASILSLAYVIDNKGLVKKIAIEESVFPMMEKVISCRPKYFFFFFLQFFYFNFGHRCQEC